MSGFHRSLIHRITPAAAIAFGLAAVSIVACSRSKGPAPSTSGGADRAQASPARPSVPPAGPATAAPVSGAAAPNEKIALADRPLGTGGTDVSVLIGPTEVDDGVATVTSGQAAADAGNAVLSAFGSNAPAPKNSAARFNDLQASLSPTEYDLTQLSATLPNDASKLDVFVRDTVALDPYSGILRGALGTWLSRAGGPDDKVVLLSMLLAKHHIDYAIVRGTLSAADQTQLLAAASARPVPTVNDDRVSKTAATQADTLTAAGTPFASWAAAQAHIASTSQTPFAATHYWIQVRSAGGMMDLDPSLPSLQPGAHLGSIEAGYKPAPFVAAESWYAVQFRVVGVGRDKSRTVYLESTERNADVEDVPLRLLIAPVGDANAIASARTFQTRLRVGSHRTTGKNITLDGSGAPAALFIEVRTRTPQGEIKNHEYRLFDSSTAASDVPWRVVGTHTYLVENGAVNQTFALNELLKSLRNFGRATDTNDAKKLSLYPLLPLSFLARDDALAAALARRSKVLLVRTTPSIVGVHSWNTPGGATLSAFDIVTAARDSASSDRQAVVASNLARSSGDAAIEGRLIGTPKGDIPALFDASRVSQVSVQTISTANARDEMATSLANGNIVLAPAAATTPAVWWEIDPKTGSAIARQAGGGGQEFAEEDIDYAEIYEQAWLVNAVGKAGYNCAKEGMGSLGCKVAMCGMTVEVLFSVLGQPGFSMTRFATDVGKDLSGDKLCELEMGPGGEGGGGH